MQERVEHIETDVSRLHDRVEFLIALRSDFSTAIKALEEIKEQDYSALDEAMAASGFQFEGSPPRPKEIASEALDKIKGDPGIKEEG